MSINWELPDDESGLEFDPVQSGFVDEMTRRLLGLRIVDRLHVANVREALAAVRSAVLGPVGSEEKIEVTLYVYDRQKSALVCVASVDAGEIEKSWASFSFKPGRGIVGFAFRERSTIPYRREDADKFPQADRYELVLNENPAARPWWMICVPLFYAGRRARCVGVLSLASRQPQSRLAPLALDPTAFDRLTAMAESWYATDLAGALGVLSTSKFWRIS